MRLVFSCGAALQGPSGAAAGQRRGACWDGGPAEGALGRCRGSSEGGYVCPSRQASGLRLGVAMAKHCLQRWEETHCQRHPPCPWSRSPAPRPGSSGHTGAPGGLHGGGERSRGTRPQREGRCGDQGQQLGVRPTGRVRTSHRRALWPHWLPSPPTVTPALGSRVCSRARAPALRPKAPPPRGPSLTAPQGNLNLRKLAVEAGWVLTKPILFPLATRPDRSLPSSDV